MAKKKHTTKSESRSPLIQGSDMPICIVRPILAIARQSTPTMPESLVRKALASVSLNIAEKGRVFASDLDEFQMYQLEGVFSDEQNSFRDLYLQESSVIVSLQARMIMEAFLLASCYGHAVPAQIERALIARMVKRCLRRGMGTALSLIPKDWWAKEANPITATVWRDAFPADHAAHARARTAEPERLATEI